MNGISSFERKFPFDDIIFGFSISSDENFTDHNSFGSMLELDSVMPLGNQVPVESVYGIIELILPLQDERS